MFLKELGMTHRIQHFAIAFSKDKPDHPANIQSADVTYIHLNVPHTYPTPLIRFTLSPGVLLWGFYILQ